MPELPEVETIVRLLCTGSRNKPALPGHRFGPVQVFWKRSVATPGADEFEKRLETQNIIDIKRRGKFIVLQLSQDFLIFHLRMSGDLRVEPAHDGQGEPLPAGKHDRILFSLDGDEWRLAFEDARKFGRAWLVTEPESVLGALGPEPLDAGLTAGSFFRCLNAYKRQLKPLLMDQRFLAGMGNIYTDEALFHAGLHPLLPANRLTQEQAESLLAAIRKVLSEGIQHNGASIDWVFHGGNFQNIFFVYQRTGEPCLKCNTPIERIIVGQRGTHFCPHCQPIV